MKHTKKMLALFLALAMAFSLMAVTAAAYGAEEHDHDGACSVETIQPRKPAAPECPHCNQIMPAVGSGNDFRGHYTLYWCEKDQYDMKIYW